MLYLYYFVIKTIHLDIRYIHFLNTHALAKIISRRAVILFSHNGTPVCYKPLCMWHSLMQVCHIACKGKQLKFVGVGYVDRLIVCVFMLD